MSDLTQERAGRPHMIRSVAIVGGGFSGALQAINLLRHAGPKAVLIERRPAVGRGVAYSVADPTLLLNVRAANMSAFPDDASHFSRWLDRRLLATSGFVPRALYGEYLAETLDAARASEPGRIEIVQGEAVGADILESGVSVRLADGRTIDTDALVLAVGNLPPVPPDNLDPDSLLPGAYAPDPWQASAADDLGRDDVVLIVGTSLTMVDAALLLDNRGFRGKIVALSRRGLLPRPHGDGAAAPGLGERPPVDLTGLIRAVRARTAMFGWQAAVDELRPYTQSLWLAATDDQRARFLRHLRPWWEVHRHRLAPEVAARLAGMRAEGRLTVVAGKTLGFAAVDQALTEVRWRRRGAAAVERLRVRRIINCSGPRVDLARTGERLLQDLREKGLVAQDTSGLGLAVDRNNRLIGANGRTSDRLFALGPLTRGTFWEITAVPDIRVQTWTLARRLSNAHWIGAEGL